MILLDTNALLWLEGGHARARPLARFDGHLYLSPATLLELQVLIEAGRLRQKRQRDVVGLIEDPRWLLDDPPSAGWFREAMRLSWTREPFDRLLAAHARYRGWRLATGDSELMERLGPGGSLEL